jgi:hypothetical protein
MAIVVEEEQKSSSGLVSLIVWALIFIVVGVAVYYVFFKRPDLVEQATPSLTNTAALSRIELKPDEVINSPNFQALRSYVEPLTPPSGGRANPFLGNF